jgi:hypothetical protein
MSFYLDNSIPSLFFPKIVNKNTIKIVSFLSVIFHFLPNNPLFFIDKHVTFTMFSKQSVKLPKNSSKISINFGEFQKNLQKQGAGPGLYFIQCKENEKIYFGQSDNVLLRLGRHYDHLTKGVHHCKELQTDWKNFSNESFFFGILAVGNEWADPKKRLEKESELISLNLTLVYNKPEQSREIRYKRPVLYKNVFFSSIAAAAKSAGFSETTIRHYLADEKNTDWVFADSDSKVMVGYECSRAVIVHDVWYPSIRKAAVETKITRQTLMNHLNSSHPKHFYCRYAE